MDSIDVEKKLYELSGRANSIMRAGFDSYAPLYKENSETPEKVQFVFIQLFSSCYLSSESALILIANARLWDTEIIYRSILEGTIKLFYLCHGSSEEVIQKCDEFWNIIPEFKQISRHNKAKDFLSKIGDNSLKWLPIRDILLKEEDLKELIDKYPTKYRKQLEQKWSFSEMIKTLSSSDIKGFDTLIAAYYGYSLGSHMTHQDGDAISLKWDRNRRGTDRRTAIELAHGARLISDILSLFFLRLGLYINLYKISDEKMKMVYSEFAKLQKQTDVCYDEWFNVEYQN
jgi:hypothetical protein